MQPIGSAAYIPETIIEAGAGTVGAGPRAGAAAPVVAGAPADSAAISPEARAKARAGAWASALDAVQSTLAHLRPTAGGAQETRKEVQGILSAVRGAAAGGPISNVPPPFTVSDIAEGVERFRVIGADLKPGESAAVEVTVTQSAQQGVLFLHFGGQQIDLAGAGEDDASARFKIEIAGAAGVRELAFSSGTTLEQLADTINALSDVIGVRATVDGDLVRIASVAHGANAFVSVGVLEDGGALGAGVLHARADDSSAADPDSAWPFDGPVGPIRDLGQSLLATINGHDYTGDGLRLRSVGANIDAIILLEQWRAQTLGTFTAATVSAPQNGGPPVVGASPSAGLDLRG